MWPIDVEIAGHHVHVRPHVIASRYDDGAGHGERAMPLWEVVCTDCGDDHGPYESQPEAIRVLRGPYRSEDRAASVATRHAADTRPL